jgi:hypothetical protein
VGLCELSVLGEKNSESEKDYLSQRRKGAKFGVLFKGLFFGRKFFTLRLCALAR